jgi:amidase
MVGATAVEIAHAVQRGDATATGVLADHLEHALIADRVLDCLRTLRAGEALAEAELVDEQPDLANLPLAGVPVVVSEDTPVAGLPTWHGSAAARTGIEPADHESVRRWRGAGAVVLGVARMSELGLWPTTDDASGITRNPWRSDHSPGGACGGAAAVVAAGLAPLAQGTDGLGAIRTTAAACGLVGVSGPTGDGILATTVADAALGLATLTGRLPHDLGEPSRLRIGVCLRSLGPSRGADADARTGVARAARLLVGAGHNALRAEPARSPRLGLMALTTWAAVAHREAAYVPDPGGLQRRTRRHASLGAWAQRRGLVRDGERADWRERCRSWFAAQGLDLLLTPVLGGPPPRALAWSGRSWLANFGGGLGQFAYTAAWSLAGLPAVAVPMGVRPDGLPCSVQLVGPPGTESRLLTVAAQLERLAPWRRRASGWPRPCALDGSRLRSDSDAIALASAYATMWA